MHFEIRKDVCVLLYILSTLSHVCLHSRLHSGCGYRLSLWTRTGFYLFSFSGKGSSWTIAHACIMFHLIWMASTGEFSKYCWDTWAKIITHIYCLSGGAASEQARRTGAKRLIWSCSRRRGNQTRACRNCNIKKRWLIYTSAKSQLSAGLSCKVAMWMKLSWHSWCLLSRKSTNPRALV